MKIGKKEKEEIVNPNEDFPGEIPTQAPERVPQKVGQPA